MIHTDCIEGSNRNSLKQSILLCLCTLFYSFSYTLYVVYGSFCCDSLLSDYIWRPEKSNITTEEKQFMCLFNSASRRQQIYWHEIPPGLLKVSVQDGDTYRNLFIKKIQAVLIDVLALPLRAANQIYGSIESLKLLVLRNRSFLQDKLAEARSFFPNWDHHIGTALDGACK